MTKLEALEDSVKKWEGICLNERDIQAVRVQCSLCELYYHEDYDQDEDYEGCDDCCPLVTACECCLQRGTIWDEINNIVKTINRHIEYLSDVNNSALTALCHTMRDLLIRLRDEEKRSDFG